MTELALVIAIVITMTGLIAPHFRDSWRSSSLTSAVELNRHGNELRASIGDCPAR